MSIIEAIILSIIQGLTEFLPISSSGHIELGAALLNVQSKDNLLFSIIVHAATALSTVIVYRKDIGVITNDLLTFKKTKSLDFVIKVILSTIPVILVGLFFEKQIKAFFGGNTNFVGSMLIITAIFLLITYFVKKRSGNITYPKALLIGLAQAFAVLPGISRSGATIATALIAGIEKDQATRFSFFMVLIPILGASFLKLLEFIKTPAVESDISVLALVIAFVFAFLTGIIACKWMILIVRKGKLIYFSIYCFIIGGLALFL